MRKLIPLLFLLMFDGEVLAQEVDLLVYRVKERDAPAYISRILVSDAYVRIDEGENSPNGYTLYNRVSHRIYNVDPEEETVLVLQPPVEQPVAPGKFHLEERLVADPAAPPLSGHPPRQLGLWAEGKHCRTLQVVEGLMPRAVQGLRELRLALARLQGQGPANEMQDPCDLAEYLYAPARHLGHGLPLADVMAGKRQVLVDFDPAFEAPDELFQVPAEYERVVPPLLTGR